MTENQWLIEYNVIDAFANEISKKILSQSN